MFAKSADDAGLGEIVLVVFEANNVDGAAGELARLPLIGTLVFVLYAVWRSVGLRSSCNERYD